MHIQKNPKVKTKKQNLPKNRLILGFTGEKLAGKGTVAAYLADKYGAHIYRMSGILDDILRRLHLPIEREKQINLVLALREKFGEDILARTLQQDIVEDPYPLIVIDGIRMPQEVALFQQLEGFMLVSIRAPLQVRFARRQGRTEKQDEREMSFAEFKKIEEESPTEKSIAQLCQQAQVQIVNRGNLAELYAQVRQRLLHKYFIA